jgi:hypothetical protein
VRHSDHVLFDDRSVIEHFTSHYVTEYECLHLYPVPSTMSASMRAALYPSGAKDDPRDADLLLGM